MKAFETMGIVDEDHQLRLDRALPLEEETRVRVIILYPLSDEIDEDEWLRAAAKNPAFAFLHGEEEIYSLDDGETSHDETTHPAFAEEEALEHNPRVKAEIEEACADYERGDYVTLEEFVAGVEE